MNKFTKLLSLSLILGLTLLFSCKKDDAPENNGGKTAKFTITVNGINVNDDYASFVIVGGDYAQSKTVWKVNGVERSNELGIGLDEDDFAGSTKTYVIESTKPLNVITAGIQCINYNAAYTISYKAEINGQVVTNEQNISVAAGKDYTHDFQY